MERGVSLRTGSDVRAKYWEEMLSKNDLNFEKNILSVGSSSWITFDIEATNKISFDDLCKELCIPNKSAIYYYTE